MGRGALEPARGVNYRRLAQLYVVAAQCHAAGRVDDAVGYLEASHELAKSGGFDEVPYEDESRAALCTPMPVGPSGGLTYAAV